MSVILLSSIVFLAAAALALAISASLGDYRLVNNVFRVPGALLLLGFSLVSVWFALRVCSLLAPGEPLRTAWFLIAIAAAFDAAGGLLVQVLSMRSPLNIIETLPWWTTSRSLIAAVGHILSGTCRFSVLSVALYLVLRAYRRTGFLGRLKPIDWCVLAAVALYVIREGWDTIAAFGRGKPFRWLEALGWPVDPLLLLLLLEAILLFRSVQGMGNGWIGRTWRAFCIGVFLVALGDILTWAEAYGYFPWPWSAATWFLWTPAAAAFAVAPLYQQQAIHLASSRAAVREDSYPK